MKKYGKYGRSHGHGGRVQCAAGCKTPINNRARTCGKRECLAKVLHSDGLLSDPTVECLNAFAMEITLKQISEMQESKNNTSIKLREQLVRYHQSLS